MKRTLYPNDIADVIQSFRDLLHSHEDLVNRLNVYPVPDGDTGTNMARTLDAVAEALYDAGTIQYGISSNDAAGTVEVDTGDNDAAGTVEVDTGDNDAAGSDDSGDLRETSSNSDVLTMQQVCHALSFGSLMGARGNSGVILSQILRGFAGVIKGFEEVDEVLFAQSLRTADAAAREAVLKPVEGTLLTVVRAAAAGAEGALAGIDYAGRAYAQEDCTVDTSSPTDSNGHPDSGNPLYDVIVSARQAAADALERTPEMLPVLAEAGVVDAGGRGFLLLFDALLHVVADQPLPTPPPISELHGHLELTTTVDLDVSDETGEYSGGAGESSAHLSTRYEVMYLLDAPDSSIPAFKEVWAGIGDSIVVVGGDGIWNCHIHTNDIGDSIEAALDIGRPKNIRVTDLAEQVQEERWVREVESGSAASQEGEEPEAATTTSVVAVVNGEGIGRIFRSLGVHHHVQGGQSMNPSVAEMLAVIDEVPSPEVVILPNNDNILPVALQAAELSTKTVEVVPTGGSIEGFAALLEYDPQAHARDNVHSMAESARRVASGEVTVAVRDAEGPEGQIKRGDWLGLTREGIAFSGESIFDVTSRLIDFLLSSQGGELVTLIEGEGSSTAVTRQLRGWLSEEHPAVELEVHDGGQPLYPYLIGVE